MAKIAVLPAQAIIDGFKGKLDYYVHHQSCDPEVGMRGVPCVRSWPRSPGHRRSPSVEATWPAFTYAVKNWHNLSDEVRQAYNDMAGAGALTGRDLYTRSYIKGLFEYPTGTP